MRTGTKLARAEGPPTATGDTGGTDHGNRSHFGDL